MDDRRKRASKQGRYCPSRRPPTWKKGPMRLFQAGQRRGRTTSTGLFIPITRDSSWRGSSTSASTSRSGERRSWRKRWSFQRDRYRLRRRMSFLKLISKSILQVKIWFQNRRAKDRKQTKKRDEVFERGKHEMVANINAAAAAQMFGMPPSHAHPLLPGEHNAPLPPTPFHVGM